MTDGNPFPDQEPLPPASTGWSGDLTDDDDELAPPFLPGGPTPEPGAGESESGPEAFPFEPGAEPAHGAEVPAEDDFPFEAFQIEGGGDAAAVEDWTGVDAPEAGTGQAHELADRLEAMAHRLRAEGAEAAEAEMSSPDRFTALLAGLLAGYLAGRR